MECVLTYLSYTSPHITSACLPIIRYDKIIWGFKLVYWLNLGVRGDDVHIAHGALRNGLDCLAKALVVEDVIAACPPVNPRALFVWTTYDFFYLPRANRIVEISPADGAHVVQGGQLVIGRVRKVVDQFLKANIYMVVNTQAKLTRTNLPGT